MKKLTRVALTVAMLALPAWSAGDRFHFELERSMPAAGSTVSSPEVVALWFSEVPQANSVSIRLLDAAGALVEAGDAVQHEEQRHSFSVTPAARLAPGAYTVQWRGIGSDGHVVRDAFGFTVTAR